MDHNNGGLVQMIFLFKGVIFRFHVNFPRCGFNVRLDGMKKRTSCGTLPDENGTKRIYP